ncbi:MAG TPA: tetratricopeptide repeat protein [Gemmatimonadaceae bacterium]|nr:tetratricopeptide repeat protein [Gemmatimonadaceae bacterium]
MEPNSSSRRSHALRGALLLAGLVGPAVLGLLILGHGRRQPALAEAAFRLTVLTLAAGAVSGATYDATRRLRGRGVVARTGSWWLVGGVAAALLLLEIRIFLLPLLAPGSTDALYAARLSGVPGAKFLVAAVILFGWVMADAATEPPSSGIAAPRGNSAWGSRLAVTAVVIIWEIASLAGDPPPARVLPQNVAEARRLVAAAERDARDNPGDGEAQFAYGLSLMFLGRNAEARPVLERAEKMLPDQAWPANALGWVLLAEHDYAGALPRFERAVKIDPGYVAATENLAWTLARLHRNAEAEAAYAKAVRMEPRDANLAADYAVALFNDRKADRALAQIYRAIKLDSTDSRYHAAAGYFLRSKARFADARLEFGRAVELDPGAAGTWVQLGVTDFLLGDARGAAYAFASAVKRDSTAIPRNSDFERMWQSARRGKTVLVEGHDSIAVQLESPTVAH